MSRVRKPVLRRRHVAGLGLVLVAVAVAFLAVVQRMGYTPVFSGAVPASVTVPSGSVLRTHDGDLLPPMAVRHGFVTDTVVLPSLLPGTYDLDVPAGGLGGLSAATVRPLVLGYSSPGVLDWPGVVVSGWWWVLVAALSAGFAVGLRSRRWRRFGAVLAFAGALGWVVGGVSSEGWPSVPSLLAGLTAGLGALGVVSVLGVTVPSRSSGVRFLGSVGASAVAAAALAPGLSVLSLVLLLASAVACLAVIGRVPARPGVAAVLACAAVALLAPVALPRALLVALPDPPTLEQCLEQPFLSTAAARYGDCWRALAEQQLGQSDPAGGLKEVLQDAYASGIPPGSECRLAGDALGALQASRVEDPRVLLPELRSVCDFANLHGWSIGALEGLAAEDMGLAAVAACALPGPVGMPDDTFVTQCWHGVGQAVARHTGFDIEAAAQVCLLAPELGPGSNCAEGFVSEASDEEYRSWDGQEFVRLPAGLSVPRICAELPAEFSYGCYRYVGGHFATRSTDGFSSGFIASETVKLCRSLKDPVRSDACWSGLGSVLASYPSAPDADSVVRDLQKWCAEAPGVSPQDACLQRGITNFIDLDSSAEQIRDYCSLVSVANRERACRELENLASTLAGKDL